MDSSNSRAKVLLEDELAVVGERLQAEARVPSASLAGGDFLDLAQGLEHQELARLSASRLSERAKRLQIALSRVSTGEYGICVECGATIAPARLGAIPDRIRVPRDSAVVATILGEADADACSRKIRIAGG